MHWKNYEKCSLSALGFKYFEALKMQFFQMQNIPVQHVQIMQVLTAIHFEYSVPLYALDDSKNCSEIAVGNVTQ